MNRQKVLFFLLLLLAMAAGYAWFATPRQQKVDPTQSRNLRHADEKRLPVANTQIGLDFSGGEKLDYQRPKRDLFRPLYEAPRLSAAPSANSLRQLPAAPVLEVNLPPVPQFPAEPQMYRQGPKPIPPLKVLGFLEKGGQYTVFLSSNQGDIHIAKRGDRFADGLLVRELDRKQVVISRDMNDPGLILPLGEIKSQRISSLNLQSDRPSVPTMNELEPQNLVPPEIPPPGVIETRPEP